MDSTLFGNAPRGDAPAEPSPTPHAMSGVAAASSVAFVVPAYNEERMLERCLASLQRQQTPWGPASALIVVDNQSTDRTAAVAEAHGATVVSVPPGAPARARNAGARACRSQWLAFVDADCELDDRWLQECLALAKEPEVVAVGAAMCPPGDRAPWVERAWYAVAHAEHPAQVETRRWLPSFNLLVRREAFEQAGGFDESLTTCEDCAIGYRLAELGTLLHLPAPLVVHHGESKSLGELFRREAWRSRGNLRLAYSRPADWRNWVSLLIPLVAVSAALVAGLLAVASLAWPSLGLGALGCLIVSAVPFALLLVRRGARSPWASPSQMLAVFAAYLAGRAFGLAAELPRVGRTS